MGGLRTVVMRAVETRATPENTAQYENLEGVVGNRAASESEDALRVVAVKKPGDIRLEQVTLEVKKPSAVARRARLLEAMAAEGCSYRAERRCLEGLGGWGRVSTAATIVRPPGGAAGGFWSTTAGLGRVREEDRRG